MVGQIAWNGNFCMEFEIDVYKNLHLVAGINPYQSSYKLEPGVNFETPRFIYTILLKESVSEQKYSKLDAQP